MINFNKTAIQLYLKLFGRPDQKGQLADGITTVLDGNTAIAVTEACLCEVAVLGSSFSEQVSALAWLSEQQRVSCNLFDQKLHVQYADSPRGALATAMGVTMSGHRSSVFLNAQDLASCLDLLHLAVGRRLPLVIHLDNQLLGKQGNSHACGHEVLHQVTDSGCIILMASNVQEAVDFTLIARNISEISLTPVIVAMDNIETASSIQDVRLPSRDLVFQFIGRHDEIIETPSIAQKQLFPESRHRLHRWHDIDKPTLHGALLTSKLSALGNSAQNIYFDSHTNQQLDDSYARYSKLTARKYQSISSYGIKKADIIFISLGSAIESLNMLRGLVKQSNKSSPLGKMNIGVIGLSCLRPFQGEQLAASLGKCKQLVILDKSDVPLADDAPLMREIRSSLHQKNLTHISLHSIIYGLDGAELNMADLLQLCSQIKALENGAKDFEGHYLGVQFNTEKNHTKHPKQQVMLDVLSRYYPKGNSLGISSNNTLLQSYLAPKKAVEKPLFIALNCSNASSYSMDLCRYVYQLMEKPLRSLISPVNELWAQRQTDYLALSDNIYTLNSTTAIDYFMVIDADSNSLLSACTQLNPNGSLFFTAKENHLQWSACLDLIKQKNLNIYQISNSHSELDNWEKIIGSLTAKLKVDFNLTLKLRKILSIRQASLLEHSELRSDQPDEQKEHDLAELFKQAMDNLQPIAYSDLATDTAEEQNKIPSPLIKNTMSENFAQAEEGYDSLPRFLDQINLPTSDLCADPFLATAVIPSLTASFNDLSQINHKSIPSFNPAHCSACGDCWENCPDSAIATVALSPQALIDAAINNVGADALRSVSSKMAARIAKQLRLTPTNKETDEVAEALNAGDLLSDAMHWLKEKSGLPEDRLKSIEADYHKALPTIADLPIVSSDLFFYSQEKQQNGSGELFSLVINPQSCKSCGLCTELCETDALSYKDESNIERFKSQAHAKSLWEIWQQMPDTLSATIERIKQQQQLTTGAALMLSRHHAFAMSGGDLGEPASGEKIALRQILSGVEYHQQPLLSRFINELQQLKEALKDAVNVDLSQALPTDNLANLASKLSDIKTRQVDLNDLLDSSEQLMEGSAIDAPKVRDLVNDILKLNELLYKLSTGSYGLGRSRYSLCMTSASLSQWAGSYPNNPFHVPVSIDMTGESAQIATGLVQGQMNDILSAISLKRKAKSSIGSSLKAEKFDLLEWSDLTHDEQQLCPPLLLVGGDDILAGQGLAQISLLLNSDYPIKIVVFSELDMGLVNSSHIDSKNNLALMAMSQRNAYVAQSSIAKSNHLQQCIHDMLHYQGASILRIYAPSPNKHGFKPEQCLQQASLAVKTRLTPLFSYNPESDGVFGSRLSLAGNENLPANWVCSESSEQILTPINWAINEKRFQTHFSKLSDAKEKAPFPTDILEWIKLSKSDQLKKTPYYTQGSDKIAISKAFAFMIIETQKLWQTLQELAGLVTPFTQQVEKTIAAKLAEEHQQELDNLRKKYEAKLKQLEENYHGQAHNKIRNQLLGLAGYDV